MVQNRSPKRFSKSGSKTVINSPAFQRSPSRVSPFGLGVVRRYIARSLEHTGIYFAVLIGLFSLSFAVPLVFAVRWLNDPQVAFLAAIPDSLHPDGVPPTEVIDSLFPRAVRIASANRTIRIPNALGVEPGIDRDFLVVTWVNLARLPRDRERLTLLQKIDGDVPNQPGFALALFGERDVVRPQAYLRDRDGNGRWMSFAELPILPHTWVMLALSVSHAQIVGLHAGVTKSGSDQFNIQLLGGADLELPIVVNSKNDLLVGAVPGSRFRGMVGGIGVFAAADLREKMKDIMKSLVRQPFKVPGIIGLDNTKVWYGFQADVTQDQGAGISVVVPPRAMRE